MNCKLFYKLNLLGKLEVSISWPINTVPWSPEKNGINKSQSTLIEDTLVSTGTGLCPQPCRGPARQRWWGHFVSLRFSNQSNFSFPKV